eukprot:CAMPEP_0171233640 /NCGR_PEP_ID=MMETSP0790-20130122/41024_1 /TAXON_ID=2925 /ORGANISM="Alexandrium catenella, Strain OF101" /LENGTH=94 /DNA_ID=CAMNT_0011699905 /DNA_START=50 /DNA_END=330 /DNA_ORIENTATION=+
MAILRTSVALALAFAAGVQGLRFSEESNVTTDGDTVDKRPIRWTYFPPEPRLGIAIGGTPEEFATGEYGAKNALILLQYVKRKGYALYVDKNIG